MQVNGMFGLCSSDTHTKGQQQQRQCHSTGHVVKKLPASRQQNNPTTTSEPEQTLL